MSHAVTPVGCEKVIHWWEFAAEKGDNDFKMPDTAVTFPEFARKPWVFMLSSFWPVNTACLLR